jgi:hypothetical protein
MDILGFACTLSLVGFILILSDYYSSWKKKRALGDIPLILPNNPIYLWVGGKSTSNYDEEMTCAYEQVSFPKRLMSYLVTYNFYATGSIRKRANFLLIPI